MSRDKGGDGNLVKRWLLASVSASIAETATVPIDVTKTRLQLQNELGRPVGGIAGDLSAADAAKFKTRGMFGTMYNIYKYEGWRALYRGLPASVLRQAVYGGIGLGLYQPVRGLLIGDEDPAHAPLWKRILAGSITGGIGQAVASPTDVVRVRMQADGRLELLGKPRRYAGSLQAFTQIPKQEGFSAFYRGLGPSVSRAAVINGLGIASYDHSKQIVVKLTGQRDGLVAQVAGALVSGLVSAVVSSPFDVVKTRMMNDGADLYKGPLDCLVRTVKSEGPLGLMKGFSAAYFRLAPWQVVGFLALEQLNKLVNGATM